MAGHIIISIVLSASFNPVFYNRSEDSLMNMSKTAHLSIGANANVGHQNSEVSRIYCGRMEG